MSEQLTQSLDGRRYVLNSHIATFFLIAVLFVVFSGFTFPSPEVYMYRTLFSGRLFYMYSDSTWDFYDPIKNEGRLQLLVGMPQNAALLFTNTPTVFSVYLMQAALVLLLCLVMMQIHKALGFPNKLAFYSVVVLFFSKHVVFSFYHPVLAETLLLVFLAASLLFYLRFVSKPNGANLALLFLFSILTCISKISGAFLLLVFGTTMLASDIVARQRVASRFIAHAVLVVLPLVWFIMSRLIAGESNDKLVWGYNYLSYTWRTDAPVLFLIVPLGILLPVLGLYKKREGAYDLKNQICAGLCSAGAAYVVLLILFGKHSDYHLAPVYFLAALAAPSIMIRLSQLRMFRD